MANLGTLTLDLVAKIGGFTGPLDKAGRESKKFTKSVEDGFNKMGAAVGIAALAAAGGIALFVKQSIDAADAASKAAQSTGLTVEAFTGLQYAAKLADLDIEKFKGGMTKLNKTVGEAISGGKEQAAIFKALGISVKDADGNLRSADKVLLDIAAAFSKMPDIEKPAAAMKLFGKSGADMIPFLNAGKDGITALVKEAEALGLVMSTTQAQASEQFNDSLTTLGQVSRGAANNVTQALLPALNSLTGMMIDVAKDTGTASEFGTILAGVLKFVASTALSGATAVMNIGRAIGGVAAAAAQVLEGEFKIAWATIQAIGEENKAATAITDERIKKLMSSDYEKAGKRAATITGVLGKAHKIATDETQKHLDAIKEQIKALQLLAETVGWTEENVKLYKLGLEGATPAQLKVAEAALNTVKAFKAEKDAQDDVLKSVQDYSDLVDELMTDEEKWLDLTKKRLAVMQAAGMTPTSDTAGKIVASGVTKAPTFGDSSITKLGEIDAAALELENWKTAQIEKQALAQTMYDTESELFYAAEEAKFKIYDEFNRKKAGLDKQRQTTLTQGMWESVQTEFTVMEQAFGTLTELTKNFGGEQSAAYKAMFALQKIFAAAMIIANTEIAASKAPAETTVLGGMALATLIRVTGYAQAGMVAGMGLAGMAHDGINSIPQDGTWLLKKGERVSTAETSAKLDRTLEDVSRQTSNGGAPIVNLYEDKSKAGQVETRQQDGRQQIDIWVADLMGDGRVQKAMSRKFGLQPVGA